MDFVKSYFGKNETLTGSDLEKNGGQIVKLVRGSFISKYLLLTKPISTLVCIYVCSISETLGMKGQFKNGEIPTKC